MSKVCFIVGHGTGKSGRYDPGAVNGSYHEFKIAKEIAHHAASYYNAHYGECDLMNYDGSLYLTERVKRVNLNDYDFIAEIHLNAGGGRGTEVYYSKGNNKGKRIAATISNSIAATLQFINRGAKTKLGSNGKDYFAIIRDTEPTAALVETGFIDSSDLSVLKTAIGQERCGEAIAKAVAACLGVHDYLAIGDRVKLAPGAKYYDGKSIPGWVFNKVLYVRSINGDRVVVSTVKTGAVTGAVHKKFLIEV